MANSRYDLRYKAFLSNPMYRDVFERRGIRWTEIYRTPRLQYPTRARLREIETIPHIWKMGDRYEKLAYYFYGDAELWWIIGWFNKRPAEFSNRVGDILHIPISLEDAMSALGV